ncbi:MAG: hypothetical protein CL609_12955 [Anaerolineaceae bacterium]|nr:hypothetical protein [Anaerolineaceae bacterium]
MKKKNIHSTINPVWRNINISALLFFLFFLVVTALKGGLLQNLKFIVIGIFVFFTSSFLFLIFFSQFVVPLTNFRQRLKISWRLLLYLINRHGPAVYITDGDPKERRGERLKKGPGVILLDASSAAFLRNPTNLIGAVGPGLAFTKSDDSIGGVIDLRIQNEHEGPKIEEDPFAPKKDDESKIKYDERMDRKNSTLAMTRDGIKICARISVTFDLDAQANTGNSKFGYNPQAVEKAIVGLLVDVDEPKENETLKGKKRVEWKTLPPMLAVNIWREFVSKITLNEFFPLSKNEPSMIDALLKHLQQRMKEETFIVLDDFGRPTNTTRRSEEYYMLKNNGVKVIAVNVMKIFLPDEINTQLIERWKSNWLGFVKGEQSMINEHHSIQAQNGKDQAIMDFAYGLTHYLGSISPEKNLSQKQLLDSLLNGNKYLIQHIPGLLTELAKEQTTIQEIQEWIETS